MLEGTIWQWPFNSLNPANTNIYMFMIGQELPSRGKRELRAAVAEKDIAVAQTDVTIRTRQIVNDVKLTSTIHVPVITPVIFNIMKLRSLRKGTLKVSGMAL